MKILWHLIRQYFSIEWQSLERLLGPGFFGVVFMAIFAFATGHFPQEQQNELLIAGTFLATFMGIQLSLSRLFEAEEKDGVFTHLSVLGFSKDSWFWAKWLQSMITGSLVTVLAFGAALLFGGAQPTGQSIAGMALVVFLAEWALNSLGILLMSMTLRASARQVVFVVLFYPLSVPVFLAAVEQAKIFVVQRDMIFASQWLYLLVGFAVIYTTAGWMFFSDTLNDQE